MHELPHNELPRVLMLRPFQCITCEHLSSLFLYTHVPLYIYCYLFRIILVHCKLQKPRHVASDTQRQRIQSQAKAIESVHRGRLATGEPTTQDPRRARCVRLSNGSGYSGFRHGMWMDAVGSITSHDLGATLGGMHLQTKPARVRNIAN